MDTITENLIHACEFLLDRCQHKNDKQLISWYFEAGSEAHINIIEAVQDARLTLGILPKEATQPHICDTTVSLREKVNRIPQLCQKGGDLRDLET